MRLATAVLLSGIALLAAGCGDGRLPESPPQAAQFRDCTIRTFGTAGRPVATVRADGEETRVRLVPAGDPHCPASLIARTGSGVFGSSVAGLDLDPTTARVVTTRGTDPQHVLVLASKPGADGVQVHLFTPHAQEVRSGDGPLLPLLEPGHRVPVDATCTAEGGIAVTTAEAHQPPGFVLAWDLTRTSYALDAAQTRQTGTTSVARGVADPTLRSQHPELYDDRLLTGCG